METTERSDLPGNDASWYQALLGEIPNIDTTPDAAPEPGQVVATDPDEASAEEPEPPLIPPVPIAVDEPVQFPEEDEPQAAATSSADIPAEESTEPAASSDEAAAGAPVITSVPDSDETPAGKASEAVGQPYTPPPSTGPLDTWKPDEMDKAISSSRSFRWTSVAAAIAVVGLIVVGLVLLPSITDDRADSFRDTMTVSLTALRGELPDTQESLAVATEPTSDVLSLNGLSTQLTTLSAKASAVEVVSQADLPATPPFTSSEPIDELEPIQNRMEPLATTAQAIQRRIANLVEYRTLMSGFLVLPDLPTTADAATQAELRVVLASAQADAAAILAELPSDVSLQPHEDLARRISDEFATWQVDYLEALRTGDSAAAAALIADLDNSLVALDSELVTPLAQIRRQTDSDLIDLARSIDEVTALAKGETATP